MKFLTGIRTEAVDGIQIRGDDEFRLRTKDALHMLMSLPEFAVIHDNVTVVAQGKRSGMKAWAAKPTFVVGPATWRYSALWYAGAIAHDAYHAKLYRDAREGNRGEPPAANCWTGSEAEKKCLAFQKQVLAQLGADHKIIAHIERCAEQPTYQGRNTGWRSWLDYLQRWW